MSETGEFIHLLTELRLGDRAPSQLLGDNKGGTELLQTLWLQRFLQSTHPGMCRLGVSERVDRHRTQNPLKTRATRGWGDVP